MATELFKKFNHIGYLDYKEVIKALDKIDSIEEQLNHLKGVKVKYFDEFDKVIASLTKKENLLYIKNRNEIWTNCFGQHQILTPLKIQEPVFNKYFKNSINDSKYAFWFLKFNAGELLIEFKNSEEFKKHLNSDLKELYLNKELKKIIDKEAQAEEFFSDNEINIYINYRAKIGLHWSLNENIYLIEVLRVLGGVYHKDYATFTIGTYNSLEVDAYYRHKLLKPFLIKTLNNINKKSRSNPPNNKFSQKQVCIAFFLLDLQITEENYLSILKKHTTTVSRKILQKRVVKTSQLKTLSGNKTADTKKRNDLLGAKRLLSGIKNKAAEKRIDQVISTFEANFKNMYQ